MAIRRYNQLLSDERVLFYFVIEEKIASFDFWSSLRYQKNRLFGSSCDVRIFLKQPIYVIYSHKFGAVAKFYTDQPGDETFCMYLQSDEAFLYTFGNSFLVMSLI